MATGMHGAAISLIAMTDAGDAAVTADTTGAIRLWPALDGSREPIVVSGSPPSALDVAREGDGFLIANHDAARGVELVRLDARGEVRSRARIATEPATLEVELTPHGALVLRADQAIELYDPAGTQRARLVPDPGTRIQALVGRGGRVLAIVGDDQHARAHWIELGAGTATWGARSPGLALDPTFPIALSPDHRLLLGTRPGKRLIPALVDVTTGSDTAVLVCISAAEVQVRRDSFRDVDPSRLGVLNPSPLGFIDATRIACSSSGAISWWTTDGVPLPIVGEPVANTGELEPGVGGGRVVSSVGAQLAIAEPSGMKYLGYGFRELSQLRVTPIGVLIGRGDQAPLLLDDQLHQKARYALPKGKVEWTDLLPIDERFVLRMSSREVQADHWGTAYQITVFDLNNGVVHQQLPNLAQEVTMAYEPTTRLLATSDGTTRLLLRFDPDTHSFGERFEIAQSTALRGVYLLDPALSGGLVALTIEEQDGALVVGELHGDDLQGVAVRARRSYTIQGQLRAVDRSGRVYTQGAGTADVLVHARGTQYARLPGIAGKTLLPSPAATHVAAFADGKVRLVAVDGRILWDVAMWGSAGVDWTASGELIVRFRAALAKLDLATGALRQRQCGWDFQIADKPFEQTADLPMVCDVSP